MSNTIMGLCWPLQMPASQKAVLMALADGAGDAGYCWLPVESRREALDLMKKTCLSKRTVQVAIAALADAGLLERHEFRGDGVWYCMTPPGFQPGAPPKWLASKIAKATPANAAGVSTPANERTTPATDDVTPANVAPNTIQTTKPSLSPRAINRIVPVSWNPTEAHREKVIAFGWPEGMFEEQVSRFREWEFREPKTDFDLAFHRWLRTTNDDLKGRHVTGRSNLAAGRRQIDSERIDAMRGGAMGALDRFQREGR